jgi:hypothetical protein
VIRRLIPARGSIAGLTLAMALTACTEGTTAPALPKAAPTASPTYEVGLVVKVGVPTSVPPKARPSPIPTAFRAPAGPYLLLTPSSGPPIARTVAVRGGNLPRSKPAELLWSLGGHFMPLSTLVWTDARGGLDAHFALPGSPPGVYKMTLKVGGLASASAKYRVLSLARLTVLASSDAAGERLTVGGRSFVPSIHVLLIVYPLGSRTRQIVMGRTNTSPSGSFKFTVSTRPLSPGEYVLRAWDVDNIYAQMAETFFQIVV